MAFQGILVALNVKAITSTIFITLIHVSLYPVWYHLFRAMALPILRNLPPSGLIRQACSLLSDTVLKTPSVDQRFMRLEERGW